MVVGAALDVGIKEESSLSAASACRAGRTHDRPPRLVVHRARCGSCGRPKRAREGRSGVAKSVSDADLMHNGEVGRRFFIDTCACFERAEAALTAPLLSHHS